MRNEKKNMVIVADAKARCILWRFDKKKAIKTQAVDGCSKENLRTIAPQNKRKEY